MGWTNYLNIDDTEAKASKYGRLHTWTTNAANQSGFYVVSGCIADGGVEGMMEKGIIPIFGRLQRFLVAVLFFHLAVRGVK
jgi:hypothetical protein